MKTYGFEPLSREAVVDMRHVDDRQWSAGLILPVFMFECGYRVWFAGREE